MKWRTLSIRPRLAGIWVVTGVNHVRNMNACDSCRTDWMHGFNGMSTHCLPNYVGWLRAAERLPDFTPEPAQTLSKAITKLTHQHPPPV